MAAKPLTLPPLEAPPPPGTGGRLVYAVGDVHGRYDLLKQLLARIAADRHGRAGGERPMLVFCGDYIDRGPQSAQVVEAMVWLGRRPEFELRTLKGNHEQAMLRFVEQPEENLDWLRFGGAETLQSYGVQPPPQRGDAADLVAARDALVRNLPASHRRFLEGLETMVVVGDYAFVHAGVRPGAPLDEQVEDDLLWIRQDFLAAPGPFEKVIVHGHTCSERPEVLAHRIGLDTGAYATGVLTAARLDDGGVAVFGTGKAASAAEMAA
jgi:serine/threonine protein phosphatase 1